MEKKHKVLFIDSVHPVLAEKLTAGGFICDYRPEIEKNEIPEIIGNFEGLILRSKIKLDKYILQKAEKLKFIGRVGAGLENIDLDFAEKQNIVCINAPEGNRDAVGEQALGMLLMLQNNLLRADRQVRQGIWKREANRGFEIKGKTVGIIGYGNMGSAFAQRLAGFEAEVIAYDKYNPVFKNNFARSTNIEEIFERADILSLHVPLTDETFFMVDSVFLNKFSKNIVLINTARGKVVKTCDLVAVMKSGKVSGAALDVLEYESISFEELHREKLSEDFEYLINSDRVVLSPHIAGWTHESNQKLASVIADKIIASFGTN